VKEVETVKRVYYYSAVSGAEMRGVVYETSKIVVVGNKGIAGVIVARSCLDQAGDKYFTTPQRAIEGYIATAEMMLGDPLNYRPYIAGLPGGIRAARARLKALPHDLPHRRIHHED
jgi:hypothetical protein